MPRPAAITRDEIRATVLAMLAEAGDPEPPSGARFRKVVSVRKLRARLGAGDPTTLSRALNDIEAEVVRAGLADVAIPELPDEIATHMRALWHAAVAVQLDDVMRLRADAAQQAEAAAAASHEADLRTEMLRVELAALRSQLDMRDTELATLRADCRSLTERTDGFRTAAAERQGQLEAAQLALTNMKEAHAREFAAVHTRYEGLSRQLLQETGHQRHALQTEREQLTRQIADAQERAAALEALRDRLLGDLAAERDARLRAAAEGAALITLVAEQRALLAAIDGRARTARPSHHRTPGIASPPPAASRRRRPK
ncbi:plasmid replication DNA-binding protein KfrA [Paraburkholderia sp. RAU2J]|uniref:DNA-binding protein n=1 Tax=Paraburkholderia sp. RAU2J TaxID=1938810 RepID=UPI000EB0A8D6|nr:DNA-binding protein [Paraburkholderia sp. RAU2J]RKT20438.1 plasmid replication DNA-binding protein KfrA [Paraburkholderia sp. RAU2J]